PDDEARRNITVTPTWTADDLTHRLHDAICARLDELPALPAKMGIAIDTGPHRLLHTTSADFRIERGADTPLILRADGAGTGCPITEATAIDALIALANWFVETNGAAAKRMAPHIAQTPLAKAWTPAAPSPAGAPLTPGRSSSGHILGAPFGSIEAAALAALLQDTHAPALRVTPWRLFQLEGTDAQTAHGFITDARDPLLSAHACPGAPACAAATVDTRALARRLAAQHRDLHVSGCAKGCAHPKAAALTLTGRDGAYDLVEQGHPWDQPRQRGLSADALLMTKA
ncbi:MAG: cobalamin biosynthesis protein CobG, partial [Pseudomonadota bacterium]